MKTANSKLEEELTHLRTVARKYGVPESSLQRSHPNLFQSFLSAVCPSVRLFMRQEVNQINHFLFPFVRLFIRLSVCASGCQPDRSFLTSVCLSVCAFVCLFVCLEINHFLLLFICLFSRLEVNQMNHCFLPFVRLSICASGRQLDQSFLTSVCPSFCFCIEVTDFNHFFLSFVRRPVCS